MRNLWIITSTMVAAGVALLVAGLTGVAGPIALVCGVLLLWSAVVKAVVLRIWRSTLAAPAAPAALTRDAPRPDDGHLGRPG